MPRHTVTVAAPSLPDVHEPGTLLHHCAAPGTMGPALGERDGVTEGVGVAEGRATTEGAATLPLTGSSRSSHSTSKAGACTTEPP